jgi:quercetin dioxygenase-like cupin family protein
VVIQALRGSVRVRTQRETYELTVGRVLVLDPEVVHDVEAVDAADMLLTVSLVP